MPARADVQRVCGLTDPFCGHAFGAKVPDLSNTRTLPYTRHGRRTISSNFEGSAAFMFLPQYTNDPVVTPVSVVGGNVITWETNFTPATPFANVSRYRVVSSGYRVRNISAPLYSSGMVHVRALAQQIATSFSPMDGTSYAVSDYMDLPLQDCKNLNVIVPHTSQPLINFYSPLSVPAGAAVTSWQSPGFVGTTVLLSGGPADSGVLDVEYFIHYELVFDEGDQMMILASPPPPSNSVYTAAAAKVSSTIDTFFNMGTQAVASYMEKKALTAIAGLIGGPAPALAASSMLALTVD